MLEPKGAAELTERVRFERRVTLDDGMGNQRGDWAILVPSRRGKLRPIVRTRGSEELIGERLQGVRTHELWVRRDSLTVQVTEDDHVVDARDPERVFAITAVVGDVTGRRRWQLFLVEQGVADG
jgi:hypothetical protein